MRNQLDTEPASSSFRWLILATLTSIFVLVVLGGVVRVTESGLGCPDWPLCHGKIIPSADAETLIEYSHRMVASFVGVMVLATAVVAWRRYRNRLWIFLPSVLGLVLVIVQGALGGVTVLTELEGRMVMAHLALAEALMAIFTLVTLAAWRGITFTTEKLNGLAILAAIAALAAYTLLLTGSYTTTSGASGACNQWPLCQEGSLFMSSKLPAIHMIHRFVALLVGLIILATVGLAWNRRAVRRDLAGMAVLALGIFVFQVLVGALTVWWGLPTEMRALHLALGTGVWVAFTALALLPYTPAPPASKSTGVETGPLPHLKVVAR